MKRLTAILVFLIAGALLPAPTFAGDGGCHPVPVTPDTPTGIAGCRVYGEGTASEWGGPGVARNDCVWPFQDCQLIAIQSLQTGLTIIVQPRMFGDLYTGTPSQRIVDLDPKAVAALGLDPAVGLWPVKVWPVGSSGLPDSSLLPDTAT